MSELPSLDLKSVLSGLPLAPSEDIQKSVQSLLQDPKSRIPILVALDDDPTGTQTVRILHITCA